MKKVLLITLIGVLTFTLSLWSQTTVYGNGAGFLQKFDTNGDGNVSSEEYATAKAALQTANSQYDLNSDGILSTDERASMRAEKMKTNPQAVSRFDANGDGILDETEVQNAVSQNPSRKNGTRGSRSGTSNLQYDLDGDGILSADERTSMRMEKMKTNPQAISRFDVNGDGILDDTEMQNAISQNPGRGQGAGTGTGRKYQKRNIWDGVPTNTETDLTNTVRTGTGQRKRDGSGGGRGRGRGRSW
ncbi:hypothetical protein KAJ27_09460 [bacterium]|nr:hypothetical protein [bacterium]